MIRADRLLEMFDSIEPDLIRYPAIDPASFRAAVMDFLKSLASPAAPVSSRWSAVSGPIVPSVSPFDPQ